MIDKKFWQGKRVFITGHTGFKGTWLSLWLNSLGAEVTGYALRPPTEPSLFELCGMDGLVKSNIADVRDVDLLKKVMKEASPDIVIHMAAQPIVRESYENPADTYSVNVMGTVNLFEAVRGCNSVRAVINVTTDKCYENKEWVWAYRENEPLGGYDPYSSSKACSELVSSAYRSSFFNPGKYDDHGVAVASARAGNVIGGGDWARDRLIPDCMMAFMEGEKVVIRNPDSIRPWQHVLEPLSGYLSLAQKLFECGTSYAEAWNFGPIDGDAKPVSWVADKLVNLWGAGARWEVDTSSHPHEASNLKLDCSKAAAKLGWNPKLELRVALEWVSEWYQGCRNGKDMHELTQNQIIRYQNMGTT